MSDSRYIPEIDGLRAIAVLSVLFFHVRFPYFDGGFLGVDIFFVISGFLITRLIKRDFEEGRFSFTNFYLRRARRLFPALFTTLAGTFFFATFILTPGHLERVGKAVISALVWTSNIFFWSESGYFDRGVFAKPLLHTWSLGVEEQFYLVWPITIFACLSIGFLRRRLPLVLLIASILSLGWAERMLVSDPAGAFFLPFGRIFEFGAGAMLVWFTDQKPSKNIWLELLLIAGLCLIGYSVVFFNEDTEMPGLPSLLPTIGTVLTIYACSAKYTGGLLRNRVAVWIGLISYSLYLVHWPIIVFLRYKLFNFPLSYRLGALALSFVLAQLMYTFVETPFRRPSRERALPPAKYAARTFGLALLVIVPAAFAWLSGGWPGRWDLPEQVMASISYRFERQTDSWRYVADETLNDPTSFSSANADTDTDAENVLIIGDSHGKDVFNALYLNSEKFRNPDLRFLGIHENCVRLFSNPDAPLRRSRKQKCAEETAVLAESRLTRSADWILIAVRWRQEGAEAVADFARFLKGISDARIVIVGRRAEFVDVPKLAFNLGTVENLDRILAEKRDRSLDPINDLLATAASDHGWVFVDGLSLACNEDQTSCDATDSDGNIYYLDYGHWTWTGAQHFGEQLAEVGLFEEEEEEEEAE